MLYLSYSDGFNLGQEVKKLSRLKKLNTLGLAGIDIDSLPKEIFTLKTLRRIQVGEHENFNYSHGFTLLSDMTELERLDIIFSNLKPLPKSFQKLKQLKKLGMYHC